MRNLEMYGVETLDTREMRIVDGGAGRAYDAPCDGGGGSTGSGGCIVMKKF